MVTLTLDQLTRPQRLMLKRAYAASERRPLHIQNGPTAAMQAVAEAMIDLGLCQKAENHIFAVTLTKEGFAMASELSRKGWPNTEKKKSPQFPR